MSDKLKKPQEENRFKKILDDAGRALQDAGDFAFLDKTPQADGDTGVRVPFPYGTQPESRTGWK